MKARAEDRRMDLGRMRAEMVAAGAWFWYQAGPADVRESVANRMRYAELRGLYLGAGLAEPDAVELWEAAKAKWPADRVHPL